MGQVIKSVYGEALFNAAKDLNIIDSIYDEFLSLINFLEEEKKLKTLLETPRISTSEKKDIVSTLFVDKLSDTMINFIKILIEKQRIANVFEIFNGYKELYVIHKDILIANVTSAEKLSEEQINKLKIKLSELSKKEVEINNIVDESIIGGLLVEADGKIIDGSISSKLLVMKDSLKETVL
ncbi:MAG: ATP synthase F1 subunit delta [Clostridiales bacterium]|nr:MAG: ATP synthase F1 subunit delta [Clostridiales bacterium]